tara:strand:+ start:1281 stop:1931 length:651 start_codon:yes stop_codon:yes gene_type:complete
MIKLSKCGCLARVKKQNEIIKALNPLLRLEMRYGDKLQTHYSDNNVVLEIPNLELLSLALEDIQAEASSHAWKATSNGDSTVAVAAGNVMGLRAPTIDPASPVSVPLYAEPVYYVGGSVTVTAATGWIYAVVTVGDSTINIDPIDLGFVQIHTQNKAAGTVSVEFNTASPSTNVSGSVNEVWLPICEVSLVDGVAVVDAQTLTHNPILAIEIAEAL